MQRSLVDQLQENLARMQRISAEEEARERKLYYAKKRLEQRRSRVQAYLKDGQRALVERLDRLRSRVAQIKGEFLELGNQAARAGRRLTPSNPFRRGPKPDLASAVEARRATKASVRLGPGVAFAATLPATGAPRSPAAAASPVHRASRPVLNGDPAQHSPKVSRDDRNPVPFTAQAPASRRNRRSDLTIAALGITLGLICAMFPWYIFFNPQEFGVRAIRFLGNGDYELTGPVAIVSQPDRVGAPSDAEEIPPEKLDLFATGTTSHEEKTDEDGAEAVAQPFPAEPVEFHLVHVANGRAMLEDDSGLFLVQAGSVLPDNSRVKSIEQRNGRWVLVTSADKVLELVR